jgi:hypothetical protein
MVEVLGLLSVAFIINPYFELAGTFFKGFILVSISEESWI